VVHITFQRFKIARSVLLSTVLTGMLFSLIVEALAASGGSGTFALTGSLNTARYNHTATLLPKRRCRRVPSSLQFLEARSGQLPVCRQTQSTREQDAQAWISPHTSRDSASR
jgi:hypothetical protein